MNTAREELQNSAFQPFRGKLVSFVGRHVLSPLILPPENQTTRDPTEFCRFYYVFFWKLFVIRIFCQEELCILSVVFQIFRGRQYCERERNLIKAISARDIL